MSSTLASQACVVSEPNPKSFAGPFVYRSTDVWNSLPQSVVDALPVQSFEVKSFVH